jgi:hypothetical protein
VGRLVADGRWPAVQRVNEHGQLTTPQDLFDTLPRAVQRRLARLPGHIRAHLERLPWNTQTALWQLEEIDQLGVIDALELLSIHSAMVPVNAGQGGPQQAPPQPGALVVVGTSARPEAEAQLPPGLLDLLRGLDAQAMPFVQIFASAMKVNLAGLSGVAKPSSGMLALEAPPGVMPVSAELSGPPPKLLGGGDGLSTLTLSSRQPILVTGEDEPEVNVPNSLVDAYRADLVESRAYLSEAEGQALAEHWDVQAELFKQLDEDEKDVIPQPTLNEGGGSKGKGTLLHVGENHYIVISEVTTGAFDFIERKSGRKFTVLHRTVSNGDCLIDALHRLMSPTKVSAEEVFEARSWLSKNLDAEALSMVVTTMLNDMLVGEFPHGAGPKTLAMLREDGIWDAFKVAEAKKRRLDALKKEEAEKRKQAEAEKEKAKSGADKPKDEGGKPKSEGSKSGGAKPPPKPKVPLSLEQLDELRAFRAGQDNESIIALNEYIAEQRAKLLTSGKSDGLPHVFNKVFLPLKDGLTEILQDAAKYQDPLKAAREIAEIANNLHVEWEETHRKHLIANMPPSGGPPDENSLAFGSNGRALKLALKRCYESLVAYMRASKEERTSLLQQSKEALRVVQAQFVQLADSAIDPDAERFITNKKNVNTNAVKENTGRIANAKAYKTLKTQELTGIMLPSFFNALAEGLTGPLIGKPKKSSEKTSETSPDETPETSSEITTDAPKKPSATGGRTRLSVQELISRAKQAPEKFEKQVDGMLDTLREAAKKRAESQKTSSIDPTLKAIEYIESIKARNTAKVWQATIESIEKAKSDSDAREAFKDMASVVGKDFETIKLIFNHANSGWRSQVLPPEQTSPAMTPKGEHSEFSAKGFPIIGDPRLVYYNSTNARNVTYANRDAAKLACMGFLGLNANTAKPHGRYVLTQDKVQPADLPDTEIWIKAAPDPNRGGGGSPDQGWVEEYETPNGPMLLIYHENDCTVKLKLGSAKQTKGVKQSEDIRSPVPHFHVATLPPNAIDLAYWEKAGTEERPPQFGSTKGGAKEYQQHEHEHHIYHL